MEDIVDKINQGLTATLFKETKTQPSLLDYVMARQNCHE